MTEIFFSLSNEAIPVDNEKNTSGTTINLSEDIKIDPTTSKMPLIKYVLIKKLLSSEKKFITVPVIKPNVIPKIIFKVKDIAQSISNLNKYK